MTKRDRTAIAALLTAGMLWGLSVPLSKLALPWLGAGWLTVARFAAGAPLLALIGRRGLRRACAVPVFGSGAIGFGVVILLQNAGIEHTSVTHAALLVGAVPVLVALFAARGAAVTRPLTWTGYALALAGVGLVAGAGGDGASLAGDGLVLASAVLSAGFIAVQPRLLAGRDAAAVTAVQFAAGALAALPVALVQSTPPGLTSTGPALAASALALVATPLPFWLFAFGQARVPAPLAGAFVNLEPVVGAATGWVAFGNVATMGQLAGAVAVLAGIALSAQRDGLPSDRVCTATGSAGGRPRAWGRWSTRRGLAGRRTVGDRLRDRVGSPERGPHRGDFGRLDGRRAPGLRRLAFADGLPLRARRRG